MLCALLKTTFVIRAQGLTDETSPKYMTSSLPMTKKKEGLVFAVLCCERSHVCDSKTARAEKPYG